MTPPLEFTEQQLQILKSAIRKDLSYLEDNQQRYKLSITANNGKDLRTGNGQSYLEIIEDHQKSIDDYRDILKKLE